VKEIMSFAYEILIYVQSVFEHAVKILRYGAGGFTSCCGLLLPLEVHRPQIGLNQQTLVPTASTAATISSRTAF
jgi:hypothetical protein